MMRYPFQTALAATLALTGSLALANPDKDGDGQVTFEELSATTEISEGEFAALDSNADGVLDSEEIAAAQDEGKLPSDL